MLVLSNLSFFMIETTEKNRLLVLSGCIAYPELWTGCTCDGQCESIAYPIRYKNIWIKWEVTSHCLPSNVQCRHWIFWRETSANTVSSQHWIVTPKKKKQISTNGMNKKKKKWSSRVLLLTSTSSEFDSILRSLYIFVRILLWPFICDCLIFFFIFSIF